MTMYKNLFTPIIILFFILTLGCEVSDPDTEQPEITISYPPNNSVIGDTITIRISAADNEGVSRVAFFFNSHWDTTGDDYSQPFSYHWDLVEDSIQLGRHFTIYAKAFDDAQNEMISNFIHITYKWVQVLNDRNEDFDADIHKVYVRNTADKLQFRIETYENWNNIQDSTGLNCAIFLDTDQDNITGLSPDTLDNIEGRRLLDHNLSSYSVNDIGPEYAIAMGVDGNGLYSWQDSTWVWQNDIEFLNFKNDTNIVELEINRSDLNNPTNMDVVVSSLTFGSRNNVFWDWAPDSLHSTYHIDGNYIGN